MRKLLFAACLGIAASAVAGPVEPTTITNGSFAPTTKWYTMQITASGYYLTDVEIDGHMPLNRTTPTLSYGEQWCFVGDDTDGYTIYNRATGTGKSLAGPIAPSGETGLTGYVTLKAPGVQGQCYKWVFSESSHIIGGYYMAEVGYPNNRVNNRGNILAFWTSGADAGSSIVFKQVAHPTVTDGVMVVQTDPLVTLSGDAPITTNPDGTVTLGAGTYYFSTPEGQFVNTATILAPDGTSKTIRGRGESNAQLPVVGPMTIEAISVSLNNALAQPEKGYIVFRYDGTPGYNIVYRIPAITTVAAGPHKGRLVAVNDYRYCGGDIGGGRIDLYMSYSDDNGQTWSVPDVCRNAEGKPVAQGTGAATPQGTKQSVTNLDCGFGDPAIVSDRETGEILMVACAGRMSYFASRRDDPQPSARWWSTDGGMTWTEPDFGQWEQIYALFDDNCAAGYIDSQFIGSGRMVQSSRVKVGDYYRVYCVMSGRNVAANNVSNWVLYSDDFGRNWHILGDPMNPAVSAGADEPKCEELPDGSILLAARGNGGGRNFNVFHYTDIEKAQGRWGTHINTNLGTGHGINACNGEIMIVPVENTATGQKAYMAIQSFTNSTSREKVSLAWKVLASASDFDEPADFNTWNGFFELTPNSSGYSTMTWQDDNALGVLYEETLVAGKAYCEVYQRVTIEEMTDGQWKYAPDTDKTTASALQAEAVANLLAGTDGADPNVVGNISAEGKQMLIQGASDYNANPGDAAYADLFSIYLDENNVNLPVAGGIYTFLSDSKTISNYPKEDRWLNCNNSTLAIGSTADRFELMRDDNNTFLIFNQAAKRYIKATPQQRETAIPVSTNVDEAGKYTFKVTPGQVSIVSTEPGDASLPAIHMSQGQKPVIWTIDAPASKWVMTLVDRLNVSISELSADAAAATTTVYDLMGRQASTLKPGNIYISGNQKFIAR